MIRSSNANHTAQSGRAAIHLAAMRGHCKCCEVIASSIGAVTSVLGKEVSAAHMHALLMHALLCCATCHTPPVPVPVTVQRRASSSVQADTCNLLVTRHR